MRTKFFLLPVLLLALAGCSSVSTSYDYDKQVDFSKFKTYAFSQDDLATSVGQLNRERILTNVTAEMAAKGFTKSDKPDMIVDIYIKSQKKVEATATTTGGYGGYGYGPYRYGYGGGYSTTQVNYDEYTEGTMFISFVDATTQKIVWQGTGTKTFSETASPEKREANITYAIKQIMLNYPPKGK